MDSPEVEESRREAAIKLGMTPEQLKGLEKQATRSGQQQVDTRPIVPDAKPLPAGDTGQYRWRQTPTEVEILVPIADGIKARDVSWSISATHITLGVKGREVLRNAKLVNDVKLGAGHLWQIDTEAGQRCILATLEKAKLHEVWYCIEAGDPSASATEAAHKDSTSAASTEAACKFNKAASGSTPSPANLHSGGTAAAHGYGSAPAHGDPATSKAVGSGSVVTWGNASTSPANEELTSVERELEDVRAKIAKLRKKEDELLERQRVLKSSSLA